MLTVLENEQSPPVVRQTGSGLETFLKPEGDILNVTLASANLNVIGRGSIIRRLQTAWQLALYSVQDHETSLLLDSPFAPRTLDQSMSLSSS